MFITAKASGALSTTNRHFEMARGILAYPASESYKAQHLPPTIEGCLSFTDRSSYLEWVQQWKAELKVAVARQREVKKITGARHEMEEWTVGSAKYAHSKASGYQREQAVNTITIRTLLFMRAEGKRKSQALKAARLVKAS